MDDLGLWNQIRDGSDRDCLKKGLTGYEGSTLPLIEGENTN
jgi:hypothetical protein